MVTLRHLKLLLLGLAILMGLETIALNLFLDNEAVRQMKDLFIMAAVFVMGALFIVEYASVLPTETPEPETKVQEE